MSNELVPILGFRRSALLERRSPSGKTSYWRCLLSDERYMYVMEVEIGKAPKNSRPIALWPLRTHLGLFGTVIREVEEKIIPEWMQSACFNEKETFALALKWNQIAWIVEEGGDSLVKDKVARAHYIKEAAKCAGVKEAWIRTLLTRYFYFGQHKNALMDLSNFKGAKGVKRFNTTKRKMGRPNDNVVLDPTTKYSGRNMNPYYLSIWTEVLEEAYVLGNKSVTECYEILLLRLRGRNRNSAGEIVSYPIAPDKLPERALFLRYGSKIIRELELKRKKLGELQWGNEFSGRRGHAADLAREGMEIYDFDGTEFNVEVLVGTKHVGKPTALFAVERRSRAIVGWFVWLGPENGYAYKHCLFNAFRSKETWLARYDVSHLTGFVFGGCDQAVFDRGPGISLSVSEAVTERMRVDGLITRPREGRGKGVVENIIGILERLLADLPGAFRRTTAVRDQDEHRRAEADAAMEFDKFMQLLLHAISDHNNFMDASGLLDKDMLEARVAPNPKAIFMHRRRRRAGDASYTWPEETIYKNLLDRLEVKATRGVVTVDRAKYHSPELTRFYEHYNGGPTKKVLAPTVRIYKFAETNAVVLWEKPDGTLETLYMMEKFELQYGDSSRWLHHFINKAKNAAARTQRALKVQNGTLSAAKEKTMQEVDGLPPSKPSKGTKRANRNEAKKHQQEETWAQNPLIERANSSVSNSEEQKDESNTLAGYRKATLTSDVHEADW